MYISSFRIGVTTFSVCLCLVIFLFLSTGSRAQNGKTDGSSEKETCDPLLFEEHNVRLIPHPLLKMSTFYDDYVFLVDKSRQQLILFRYDGNYHRIKTYECTTGSNPGNKQEIGDMRTPEGVYFFTAVREKSKLISQYGRNEAEQFGIRAFDTNYPNEFDRILKKNGDDIWLHATDNPERINQPFGTKGCIVINNDDIEEISQFITLNQTPIIIVEQLEYFPQSTLQLEFSGILEFINNWRTSWEQRDFDKYETAYSSEFYGNNKNLQKWLLYKKGQLQYYDRVNISISNMRIFKVDEYYYIQYYQLFRSESYKDEGIKQLYIINEDGALKIISEKWTATDLQTSAR